LLEEFPDKDWSCSALDRLLQQIDAATGSAHRKSIRSRERTVCTRDMPLTYSMLKTCLFYEASSTETAVLVLSHYTTFTNSHSFFLFFFSCSSIFCFSLFFYFFIDFSFDLLKQTELASCYCHFSSTHSLFKILFEIHSLYAFTVITSMLNRCLCLCCTLTDSDFQPSVCRWLC